MSVEPEANATVLAFPISGRAIHAMIQAVTRSLYLGRSAERATVADALRGPGHVVLVSGEAGVGKTSLVRAARSDVESDPTPADERPSLLSGACLQLAGEPLPLAAIEDLLGERGGWPASGARDLSVASAVERAAAIGRWADLIAPRGATSATTVVVDDLQWADDTTCDLVHYLVATATRRSLSVVVMLRDAGGPLRPHVRETWLDLAHAEGARRLALNTLTVHECHDLVEALHREQGRAVPTEEQLARLAARSGGNPYLLTELMSGPDDRHVHDLFGSRLQALSSGAAAIVRQAAVLGEWVDDTLLRAAVDLPADREGDAAYADALREAVAAGMLLVDDVGYGFRHGLAHEAVLTTLLPIETRTLHQHAARAIARVGDASGLDLAARSAHLRAAGDRAGAASVALGAARAFRRLAAHGEAWTHYRTALETPPAGEDLLALALEAAEAARFAGEPATAAGVVAQAMAAQGPAGPAAAVALERLGLYHWEAGAPDRSIAAFEAAEAALGPGDTPAHAQVWAGRARAAFIMARFDEAMADADRAVVTARAEGPAAALADALVTRGTAAVILGDVEGLKPLLEGVQLARRVGDSGVLCRAYANLILAYEYTGRIELACETALQGLAVLPEHGLEIAVGAALACNATNMLIRRGRYAECAAVLDELLGGRVVRGQALHLHLERAELRLRTGDVVGARASLAATAPLLAVDEPAVIVGLATATAECFRQEGEYASCYATVAEALARTDDRHYLAELALVGLRAESERPSARIDPEAGARRARLLAALPDDTDAHDVNLTAQRLTALADAARAAGDDDPGSWTAVVALWQAAQRPHDEVTSLLRQAEAHVDRRERGPATAAVARAREIAARLPAPNLVAAADAFVRRARLTLPDASPGPGPSPPAGVAAEFGLTSREVDVLELLGEGATNREIARRLFVSERTVGVHVSHVLRKLGAANRTQAAAFAARVVTPADDVVADA